MCLWRLGTIQRPASLSWALTCWSVCCAPTQLPASQLRTPSSILGRFTLLGSNLPDVIQLLVLPQCFSIMYPGSAAMPLRVAVSLQSSELITSFNHGIEFRRGSARNVPSSSLHHTACNCVLRSVCQLQSSMRFCLHLGKVLFLHGILVRKEAAGPSGCTMRPVHR